LKLTSIGKFGLPRKARPHVLAHLHTGIDIQRPYSNYENEPVFPMAPGIVISKRNDGPYAQLIIEHFLDGEKIWTCYEHIAGIKVKVRDRVEPKVPIARFMNKKELDTFGWQFDHFHFEVLKVKPMALVPGAKTPERFFNSYSLVCYSEKELEDHFYSPVNFLGRYFK
jgi:murein DD-endopeptidase MepM/ murein hydrolase activator NlpD